MTYDDVIGIFPSAAEIKGLTEEDQTKLALTCLVVLSQTAAGLMALHIERMQEQKKAVAAEPVVPVPGEKP